MEEPSSSTPTEHVLSDAKEEDSVFLTQNNLPETNKQVGQKRKFTEISDGDFVKTKPKSKTETVCLETNEESDTLADFNTDTLVEECTLDWTENRLNTLHITSKLSSLIPVNKIISNYLHATVTLGYFDGNPVATNLEKIVNSCIEMINIDSTPFKDIDVDDISDIKSSLAYSMIFSTPKCAPELSKPGNLRKINSWKQGDVEGMSKLKYWFYNKFYVMVRNLQNNLLDCVCAKRIRSL